MSREEGFAVMDVSVDIVNDPKIRKLYRVAPELAGSGFLAYVATMGESWKAGHRVSIEDSWPPVMAFDQAVVDALRHAKLIDESGFVSMKAWKSWFTPAKSRRDQSRDRWRRANEKRANPSTNHRAVTDDVTASSPRGDRDVTASTVPLRTVTDSVPLDSREIPPPPTSGGRRKNGTNPRVNGSSPRHKAVNPRANGTSTRQVRADQKRGSTGAFGETLRRALAEGETVDGPTWLESDPEPAEANR